MIKITPTSIELVMPLDCLQQLLCLQMGLVTAIQTQVNSQAEIEGAVVVGPLAEILEATLFSMEQMDAIEAHLKQESCKKKARAVA